MSNSPTYRWNTTDFACGYDAAAEHVHPYYRAIQDEILAALSRVADSPRVVIDLGGGSGRLMERLLDRWPQLKGVVVDQSEPFLALAERRLARFGGRAVCVLSRLQDDWPAQIPRETGIVVAVVSMSAIHHLEPAEKQALYQRCSHVLGTGGVLLNGDEVRPVDEPTYHAQLAAWADHMQAVMSSGTIPLGFHSALHAWIERNVARFGEPKKSGDDCHESIETQLDYFRAAGFTVADTTWQQAMWAVLRAIK